MDLTPFTKRQILDFLILKKFVTDNFSIDENGRKFSERVENAMSNFSFSHNVFSRLELQTCKNQGLFGKGF